MALAHVASVSDVEKKPFNLSVLNGRHPRENILQQTKSDSWELTDLKNVTSSPL